MVGTKKWENVHLPAKFTLSRTRLGYALPNFAYDTLFLTDASFDLRYIYVL